MPSPSDLSTSAHVCTATIPALGLASAQIVITREQAAKAFADWENECRANPACFFTEEEMAQMAVATLSEGRAICFFAYLRQGGSTNAAIQAMLSRAKAALDSVHPGHHPEFISFWQGYAKALNDFTNGVGDKMAAKDAASGGYVQGCSQAAWASLTVGLESLTAIEIVERFATQGIEITPDAATQLRLEAVEHLPHSVIAIVKANNEQSTTRIDVGDGAVLHGERLIVMGANIVAEGGAA